jgi:hypothetical protein
MKSPRFPFMNAVGNVQFREVGGSFGAEISTFLGHPPLTINSHQACSNLLKILIFQP